MGSKARLANHLLPIILKDRKEGQYYVEPFVGGANLIDKVSGPRIGADINPYLIALLLEMQKEDFNPPHIGEAEYKNIQKNKDRYPAWLVGYVGFNLSFAAKFFGGYSRDKAGVRDHENEAKQNLKAQQRGIRGVDFHCCNYNELTIPDNSIVYCDPPYENTTPYKNNIDHTAFWAWCRGLYLATGITVFVSEYNAPGDFLCVWEKEVCSSLDKNTGGKRNTEKLFRYIGGE